MNEPDLIAAYVGVLRHQLELPRGADALLELELRLASNDPKQRPPARAPGIARLARALKRLRQHKTPADSLDQFADDLRFLRVFEEGIGGWSADAVDDLLANVIALPKPRARTTTPIEKTAETSTPIVPFRPRKPRRGG